MDTHPALEPLTVPEHVHAPDATGLACLGMGLAALELAPEAGLLDEQPPDSTSPGGLARAALRHGAHTILHGPARDETDLERALQAGLMHKRRSPSAQDVLAVIEARRACMIHLDHGRLGEASQGPAWVLALGPHEDPVALHDPRLEEGPTLTPWEEVSAALGAYEHACLLTLAAAPREHE